ncbi:hypothetical protein N219_06805 [Limosilactobacillus fermentum MTCC 8711]|nr:hypothetical protein N219_06805 [Limosilactobacillus fermentum MTCC 8711]
MIDAIVKRTVRYRQHSFIRVVRRTLAVIFPLALIGIIAQVLFIVFSLTMDTYTTFYRSGIGSLRWS